MAESKYIERQVAVDALGKQPEVYSWEDELMREQWERDKAAIEAILPADVRPVVRGEWSVAIGYDPKRSYLCSACQRMNYEPSNFCPSCGADMRGGDADGDEKD